MIRPNKSLSVIAIILVLFVGAFPTIDGQEPTELKGIVNSDTTWTKANSPYSLTGNLAINTGVTLTIAPGVTVNLNHYFIRINGTLIARGASNDKIFLNAEADGYIEFTSLSAGWDSQTGKGSIIEKAVINCVLHTGGASIMVYDNVVTKGISLEGGSPVVSKNFFSILSDDPLSTANAISISELYDHPIENRALIVDNTIVGSYTIAAVIVGRGSPTLERNIISNSYGYGHTAYGQAGIFIYGDSSPIIKQNTIKQSANGISFLEGNSDPTIINNNLEEISNYNLFLNKGIEATINASSNWWGTTDSAVIDQKIWDYSDDFDLGKVNYTPFLTQSNPYAVPDENAPTPTAGTSTSASPTPTPTVPELSWLAIVPLLLFLVSVAVIIRHRKTVNLKQ